MSTTKRAAILTAAATLLICCGGAVTATQASASTYKCHYSGNSQDEEFAGYYSGSTYVPTYGTFSDAAIEAQCLLNRDSLYPGLTVDGIYGSNTKAAVAAFQHALGIKADGYVGPQTWPYLRDAAYKNS